MTADDAAFLDAMSIRALVDPCELLRSDLLRLLELAGVGRGSAIYADMAAQGGVVLVDAAGVRATVEWARGRLA